MSSCPCESQLGPRGKRQRNREKQTHLFRAMFYMTREPQESRPEDTGQPEWVYAGAWTGTKPWAHVPGLGKHSVVGGDIARSERHIPPQPLAFPGEGLLSSGCGEGASQEGILTHFRARPESPSCTCQFSVPTCQGACPEPHHIEELKLFKTRITIIIRHSNY